MRTDFALALMALSVALASCGSAPATGNPSRGESSSVSPVPEALSAERLGNVSYMLINPSVRLALTNASLKFSADLRNGAYQFPPAMDASGFTGVHADLSHVVYGDVNHDGAYDAVLPLLIDHGDYSVLEIAAVTASGSTARHFASFPIGKGVLKSLAVTDGKIRVNFTQQIPGDPGPRNTELVLELPRK